MAPLSDRETDKVFREVRDIVHATIYGNVVTALIQGSLGGTMFWILGIPTALLMGGRHGASFAGSFAWSSSWFGFRPPLSSASRGIGSRLPSSPDGECSSSAPSTTLFTRSWSAKRCACTR